MSEMYEQEMDDGPSEKVPEQIYQAAPLPSE
jgi:hypothetical protein